jgi:hypothetical protein
LRKRAMQAGAAVSKNTGAGHRRFEGCGRNGG